MRAAMVAGGTVTPSDVDAVIAEFGNESAPLTALSPVLVSARGRRPARPRHRHPYEPDSDTDDRSETP